MKLLRIVALLVAGILVLWGVLAVFARKNYRIERSLDINAPRSIVYEHVRYFKNFPRWSPWQSYDPAMKTSVENVDGEVGAIYRWSGNDKVGTGWQEVKSVSDDSIRTEVHFGDWRNTASYSTIRVEEKSDSVTHVNWSFDMHVPFPWNAFAMLTDVNAFVGKDWELGLRNLKRVTEQVANKKYRGYVVREVTLPQRYYVGVRQTVPMASIARSYADQQARLQAAIREAGFQPAGPPAGIFWMWNDTTQTADMAAAMPFAQETGLPGFSVFPLGGAKAFVINYYGAYEGSGEAHFAMDEFFSARKMKPGAPVIEEYVTNAATEPDTAKWLTRVIYFGEK